ncbi:hypothetical protein BDQ17DRAFT_1429060 [Cyathus striatus]|nr:hypothetical protein BDQ17DRAFT_1429060 [Cyathus striatus]
MLLNPYLHLHKLEGMQTAWITSLIICNLLPCMLSRTGGLGLYQEQLIHIKEIMPIDPFIPSGGWTVVWNETPICNHIASIKASIMPTHNDEGCRRSIHQVSYKQSREEFLEHYGVYVYWE